MSGGVLACRASHLGSVCVLLISQWVTSSLNHDPANAPQNRVMMQLSRLYSRKQTSVRGLFALISLTTLLLISEAEQQSANKATLPAAASHFMLRTKQAGKLSLSSAVIRVGYITWANPPPQIDSAAWRWQTLRISDVWKRSAVLNVRLWFELWLSRVSFCPSLL